MTALKHFFYTIHPVRGQAFFEAPSAEEQAAIGDHFRYMQQALTDGILLAAGPCADDSFGIGILRMESEKAAREFMDNDPSVKANVQYVEMRPLLLYLWAGK
ncbi:MAG: YciI family protein [Anaerolineae bacterium]